MNNHKKKILIAALEQYRDSCTEDEIAEKKVTQELINEFEVKK